ncbi:amidohydrolase [Microbacterium luticocti]|uniref:amidohydrolase n=1 Tax=Microbacterium luticocti TaxID=451764 RepID=UPI00040D6535|nr:amidohydrolase [Microbacterium luticocti]
MTQSRHAATPVGTATDATDRAARSSQAAADPGTPRAAADATAGAARSSQASTGPGTPRSAAAPADPAMAGAARSTQASGGPGTPRAAADPADSAMAGAPVVDAGAAPTDPTGAAAPDAPVVAAGAVPTDPTGAAASDTAVVDAGAGRGPAWLDAVLAAQLPTIVALRRRIHAHPELSRQERATTALVHDALTGAGIAAQVLPGGTGLIADIDSGTPGPLIGLRADIDALPVAEASGLPFASRVPGVAHACGHDVHTAVLVGAALALRAGTFAGRVRLLFQPAEEAMPGGSHQLVAAGAMDGIDRVYALHCDPRVPVGQVGMRVGPITSACDMIELTVTGPGGHTSRPQLTVDVVGALAEVAHRLPGLAVEALGASTLLVWGTVRAGEASNVIPQTGELRGTLRLADRAAWERAEPVIADGVARLLAPTGARYELRHVRGVPPVVNDAESVQILQRAVSAALGVEAVAAAEQSAGAEDFAVLLENAPGALARLGVWDGLLPQVDLHAAEFRADERAIPVGVRTLVHTVLAAGRG